MILERRAEQASWAEERTTASSSGPRGVAEVHSAATNVDRLVLAWQAEMLPVQHLGVSRYTGQ